jgi:hypothetical protein
LDPGLEVSLEFLQDRHIDGRIASEIVRKSKFYDLRLLDLQ